jgi:hypothetical protein
MIDVADVPERGMSAHSRFVTPCINIQAGRLHVGRPRVCWGSEIAKPPRDNRALTRRSGVRHERERRRVLSLIAGSSARTFPGGEPWQAGRRLAPGPAALGRRAWPGGPSYRPGTGGRDDDMRR